VYVHVIPFADRSDGAADVMAVFENGVAGVDLFKRDFVAERNRVERFDGDGLVGLHDPAGELLAGLGIFDDHHADGIGFAVNNEVSFHIS
jgi:hypothetical protein